MRLIILVVWLLPLVVAAQGGKQRYAEGSDQVVDEVNQLCQQLGVDGGTIEVSTCPPPGSEVDDGCVVTIVDCTRDDDDD